MTGQPQNVELQVQTGWPADALRDPVVVNQALVAQAPGGSSGTPDGSIYLLLGHITFPLINDPEALSAYIAEHGGMLRAVPRGAFYMSRMRAEELWVALGQQLGHLPMPESPAPSNGESQP